MWTEVFCSADEIYECVVQCLVSPPISIRSRLAETLIELIPKVETDLNTFQKLVEQPCIEFETKLAGYGFQDTSSVNIDGVNEEAASNTSSTLVEIMKSLKMRFAKSKRKEILGQARAIVLADYHNTMLASGDVLEVFNLIICCHNIVKLE